MSNVNDGKVKPRKDASWTLWLLAIMVIIVVAFAAFLYVYSTDDMHYDITPAGQFTRIDITQKWTTGVGANNLWNMTIVFGTWSRSLAPMDIKMIISPQTGAELNFSFDGKPSSPVTKMVGPAGFTATYHDLNYNSNQVNNGDYINITGLPSGTSFHIYVLYLPTGDRCSMVTEGIPTTPP